MAGDRSQKIAVKPLIGGRWGDLEILFGANGACAGCWCLCRLLVHVMAADPP